MLRSKGRKWQVIVATCQNWQREFDHKYQTLLWLQYDVDKADRSLVDALWCEMCQSYKKHSQALQRHALCLSVPQQANADYYWSKCYNLELTLSASQNE